MANVTTQEQIVREAPEIEAYKVGLLQLAKERAAIPVEIPNIEVAGLTPQQTQAIQMAGQGVGAYLPYLTQAGEAYGTAAQGFAGLPQYGQMAMQNVTDAAGLSTAMSLGGAQGYNPFSAQTFMNPYQQAVTQEALREMSRQADIQRQTAAAQAVRSGAFGGGREGVQRAEMNRNLYDLQSKRILEDLYTNYSQAQTAAQNAFQNQQARQLQAAQQALSAGTAAGQAGISAGQLQQASAAGIGAIGQQTANLGQQLSALQQGDTSFLYNVGGQQQAQRQRELDAARQTALQQQYEPLQRISFLSDIYKGAPSSQQTISQVTAPSASPLSQAVGTGIAALGGVSALNKSGVLGQ